MLDIIRIKFTILKKAHKFLQFCKKKVKKRQFWGNKNRGFKLSINSTVNCSYLSLLLIIIIISTITLKHYEVRGKNILLMNLQAIKRRETRSSHVPF